LDALEIGLRCLGIGAGDRVLTTPLSAFATTLAVLRVGAVPVFVDIDRFGLLDLTAAEERLRRGGIRCLLPVHLYGHVVDLERLTALGSEFGVAVVEDCAQSIGSRFRGAPSGSAGEIAATSFYPTKNLGALGDAGALLCRNPDFAQHSRRLRNYGEADRYQHVEVGLNSRLDELQAALLRSVMLPRLEAWTTRRKEAAATYLDGIRNPRITVPGSPPGSASVWHLFPVLVEPQRRSHFREHLTQHGVSSAIHYPVAIVDQPALSTRAFEVCGGLNAARWWCRAEVSLPIHPWLESAEIHRVVDACNTWAG
jgi:dTDP-3-amino-3,4,6-trideoxy-alpha-D-glucose transaminase